VTESRRVVDVGYHAAELLDIACVVTGLQVANWRHGTAAYRPQLAAPGGRPIMTGTGLVLGAEVALERVRGPLDTPGRHVRQARTDAAAHLLTGSDLTVQAVSVRCGFGTVESLRQAFVAAYGVSPSHFRATQRRLAPA
jgi:transcriptional regulator GlxA family with amidase domain